VAEKTNATPQRRAPLTRERVLRAAIALADEGGIEALSMRKLAKELGVEAMSLYNHVANKGDLVGAMVDTVVSEIDLPSTPDWEQAVRQCAVSAYDVFLRHPWACQLVMAPGSLRIEGNPRLRYIEWLLARLREAGFSDELTYRGYHALDSHILGFTMWHVGHSAGGEEFTGGEDLAAVAARFIPQLRASGFPHLAEHAQHHIETPWTDTRTDFEFGLDLILDGLKRK
jgi:AcrR family transcriptional regulator